jgi:pimeloyl-ACP methyl ester carboxylesterase
MKFSIKINLIFLLFASVASAESFPPIPGQRYDIGGYSIHLNCLGEGQPTVIIDAGLGDDSSDWMNVQRDASKTTRVCVYDRAGYGWSDNGPKPRNSLRISHELKKLIQKANLNGPFVLVGHSFGGYNMRVFAATYPESIAGMVLVDASHENQYEKLGINLPEKDDRKGNILVLPKSIDPHSEKASILRERAYRAASSEISSLYQSAHQVRTTNVLPVVPLIVISRGLPEWTQNREAQAREKIWSQLQFELWKLSPYSQQLFANHSGHDIHVHQPEIVTYAIKEVVTEARVRH